METNQQQEPKKSNGFIKGIIVVFALAAGSYFGVDYINKSKAEKEKEKASADSSKVARELDSTKKAFAVKADTIQAVTDTTKAH